MNQHQVPILLSMNPAVSTNGPPPLIPQPGMATQPHVVQPPFQWFPPPQLPLSTSLGAPSMPQSLTSAGVSTSHPTTPTQASLQDVVSAVQQVLGAIPNHTSLPAAPASHIPAPMPAVTSSLPNSSLSALPGISIPPSTGTSLLSYSLVVCRLFISTHPSVTVHKGLPNRLLNIIGTNTLSLLCLFPPFLSLASPYHLPTTPPSTLLSIFPFPSFLSSPPSTLLTQQGNQTPSTTHNRVIKPLNHTQQGNQKPFNHTQQGNQTIQPHTAG